MIEPKDVLALVGLLFTAGIAFWAVIRWTITKIEDKHAEAQRYADMHHTSAINYISKVERSVNIIKDEYVKRADLDRDFKSLEKQIDTMNKSVGEARVETNQRLDRLLMLLGQVISHSNIKPHDTDKNPN